MCKPVVSKHHVRGRAPGCRTILIAGSYGPIRGISSVTITLEEESVDVLDLKGAFRAITFA